MSIRRTRSDETSKSSQSEKTFSPESLFNPPLQQGVKPKGVWHHSMFEGKPVRCPVAQLDGGWRGPYALAKALPEARGTFGKIRLGLDAKGRAVAVKALRLVDKPGAPTCPTEPETVSNELDAMTAAGLEHAPRDCVQVRNKVFVVMPLADGNLHMLRHAPRRRLLAFERAQLARHMLAEAAPMLTRLHGHGWVHSDIKLENFLWSRDGQLRLADFGLASDDPGKVSARGTPHTMAPEVAGRRRRDGRADVWSLGVALCEMLGRHGHIFTAFPKLPGQEKISMERLAMNQHVFSIWRDQLPRLANGDFDLLSLDAELPRDPLQRRFVEHFREVRNADWGLCQLILQHMLEVNPRMRVQMDAVWQIAQSLPHWKPVRRADLTALLQKLAPEDKDRAAVLQLLRDVQSGVAHPAPLTPEG